MTIGKFTYIHNAAQQLCCTDRHIYNLIKNGKLKAIRLGPRGLRVLKGSIDAYIKKNMYKVLNK
jgi:excisionase family DNA binding protein